MTEVESGSKLDQTHVHSDIFYYIRADTTPPFMDAYLCLQ